MEFSRRSEVSIWSVSPWWRTKQLRPTRPGAETAPSRVAGAAPSSLGACAPTERMESGKKSRTRGLEEVPTGHDIGFYFRPIDFRDHPGICFKMKSSWFTLWLLEKAFGSGWALWWNDEIWHWATESMGHHGAPHRFLPLEWALERKSLVNIEKAIIPILWTPRWGNPALTKVSQSHIKQDQTMNRPYFSDTKLFPSLTSGTEAWDIMASAGMDRRRKFDFLDAAAATAAAAEAAPVRLGGELVDVGAAARPLRGPGRMEPAERMRAAERSLKALQGVGGRGAGINDFGWKQGPKYGRSWIIGQWWAMMCGCFWYGFWLVRRAKMPVESPNPGGLEPSRNLDFFNQCWWCWVQSSCFCGSLARRCGQGAQSCGWINLRPVSKEDGVLFRDLDSLVGTCWIPLLWRSRSRKILYTESFLGRFPALNKSNPLVLLLESTNFSVL